MFFGNLGFLSGLTFNNMKLTSIEVEKKLDDPNSTLEDLLLEDYSRIKKLKSKIIKIIFKG